MPQNLTTPSLNTSGLGIGSDNITAIYLLSSTNFNTSTSNTLTQAVTGGIVLLDNSGTALDVNGFGPINAQGYKTSWWILAVPMRLK